MTITLKDANGANGMRVAGRLASEVLDYLTPFVQPGVSTNELDKLAHDFMVRSIDAGAMTLQMLPQVLKQWREPNHPEFSARTAWSLFNAYTEAAKGTSLQLLPRRTMTLHGMMDARVGFLGGTSAVEAITAGVADAGAVEVAGSATN